VLELLPGSIMSRDNVASMRKDSVCDCPWPSVFDGPPTALEAIAPQYLAPSAIHSHFDEFRTQRSR
jgi:NADH dehydrogenase